MRLAIPFTLLMGSYVAAAPSIQHAQISVEVTDVDAYDQVDALHASEELVINNGRPAFKSLPFNFTVRARQVYSPLSLPFGFKNLDAPSGFARGELGFRTEFAFRNGKLINGNRALGYHVARIFPPWTSLWSLKDDVQFLELVATSQHSGGRVNHFLELEKSDKIFGADGIKPENPIFVAPLPQFQSSRLLFEVEPIRKSSDDTNAESTEELL